MPPLNFTEWLPAIVFLSLLFGVALYLQARGLHDPQTLLAKAPRTLGMALILLAGLLVSLFFAAEYRQTIEKGSFFVSDKMLVLPLALLILGALLLGLGSRAQLIVSLGPRVRRLTIPQWVFMTVFCIICLGALFGFPNLMQEFGWRVRRLP